MIEAILFFLIAFILINSILFIIFFFFKKENIDKNNHLPLVSILIAARNEETHILKCLEAIDNLDFPEDKLEVLVGNDASEDNTAKIIEQHFQEKPNRKLIHIASQLGTAKGKANVLAQLAHQAKGDVFCITDADIEVPKTWIWALLTPYFKNKNIGTVTGFTVIRGNRFLHYLQAIDWIFALAFSKIFSQYKLPVTAMGNNMLITRKAYFATGGYENLPFSIVEDYQLFKQTLKQNYDFVQLLNKDVRAYSTAIPNFVALLQQRKRWMYGAVQLATYMKIILLLYALFFPLTVFLAFYQPYWALYCFLGKWFSQTLFIILVLKKIDQTQLLFFAFLHEFYSTFMALILPIYFILPIKVIWKGRKY